METSALARSRVDVRLADGRVWHETGYEGCLLGQPLQHLQLDGVDDLERGDIVADMQFPSATSRAIACHDS